MKFRCIWSWCIGEKKWKGEKWWSEVIQFKVRFLGFVQPLVLKKSKISYGSNWLRWGGRQVIEEIKELIAGFRAWHVRRLELSFHASDNQEVSKLKTNNLFLISQIEVTGQTAAFKIGGTGRQRQKIITYQPTDPPVEISEEPGLR